MATETAADERGCIEPGYTYRPGILEFQGWEKLLWYNNKNGLCIDRRDQEADLIRFSPSWQ
jgi:hypothetical protein